MKNKYLYLSSTIVILVGIGFILLSSTNEVRSYKPRTERANEYSAHGAYEYLMNIRANQVTKSIEIKDIKNAQNQLNNLSSRKSSSNSWVFRGPDNVGGRTRALLIDKDNSSLMFAGGVAGGIWKSTTYGQYWEQVTYEGATSEDFANLAVVSICQTSNGDIYFGTGEGFSGNHGTNIYTPMIIGSGIWKSTDRGNTFVKVTSTNVTETNDVFLIVNKLAADPSNSNLIYAATHRGLKITNDGGTSWNSATLDNPIYNNRNSTDIKTATNGSAIASIGEHCFVKKPGSDTFMDKSGEDNLEDPENGNLISSSDIGRLEFTYAPQDPLFIYCAAADQAGEVRAIYKTMDGGDNWVVIGKGGSALFQPFGSQGIYDLCLVVNPLNKNEIFIGGLDIWEGKEVNTGDLFAWSQVTLWNSAELSPNYVHADQHILIFDPKDPQTMFIGSDGGVGRGLLGKDGVKYQFKPMNKNYNVTQFYSVAANSQGYLLGGTQDNGSQLIVRGAGNSDLNGFEVLGGDGGHVVMSQINPSVAYATIYYGGLWRNNDQSFGDWNTFYNTDVADAHGWSSGSWEPSAEQASFVTPISYWETDNDVNSIDSIAYVTKTNISMGTQIVFPSHNVNKAPIYWTSDKVYEVGDTVYYKDTYRALFALGMKHEVWITPFAANWNKTITNKDWWKAVKIGTIGTDEFVTQMRFSADGNNLFFSTSENEIYRLSNLKEARNNNNASYLTSTSGDKVTVLTKIGGFGGRSITGIACDPNNSDNLMITLGNYGNESYIYITTEATTIDASSSFSNFTDITGNLPKMPVYCSLFEMNITNGIVFVGTDMGVFKTTNIFTQLSANSVVSWEPYQNGVGPVPVFQITQLNFARWNGENYGKIYIGTHGLGFFEDQNYVGIADKENNNYKGSAQNIPLNLFPNPASDEMSVSFNLNVDASVKIDVIQMNGQVIKSVDFGKRSQGENNLSLIVSDLKPGNYLISIKAGHKIGTKKFSKK